MEPHPLSTRGRVRSYVLSGTRVPSSTLQLTKGTEVNRHAGQRWCRNPTDGTVSLPSQVVISRHEVSAPHFNAQCVITFKHFEVEFLFPLRVEGFDLHLHTGGEGHLSKLQGTDNNHISYYIMGIPILCRVIIM